LQSKTDHRVRVTQKNKKENITENERTEKRNRARCPKRQEKVFMIKRHLETLSSLSGEKED